MRRSTSLMGACVCLLLLAVSLAAAQEPPYTFVLTWGSYGDGDGQFFSPYGVGTDAYGNVYVADTYNHRIQKFDSEGAFLTKWGSLGTDPGQFNLPYGVATDVDGKVYVVDHLNSHIDTFDSDGSFLLLLYNYFYHPDGVATDAYRNVYVADTMKHRIHKLDSAGNWLTWGGLGTGDGHFQAPNAVAADAYGYVYVADTGNNRIQKFDSEGAFLTKWGTYGSGDGEFQYPAGIATDSDGYVYVSDTENHRIQKFDSEGAFLTKWGSLGTDPGQFNFPRRVATDAYGNVYVADTGNHRIQKFAPPWLTVDIDVKPGSYPNSVNLGSNGVIPVAVLSSDTFDATQVSPDTVVLAGAGVAIRGRGSNYLAHDEDVDGDGFVDLVVQVETENLDPGQFQDGLAELTGNLYPEYGGMAIRGWDEITIVPLG